MVGHFDDEALLTHLLGDDPKASSAEAQHLADCEQCRQVLDEYRRVIRAIGADDDDPRERVLESPSSSVRERVLAAAGDDAAEAPTAIVATSVVAPRRVTGAAGAAVDHPQAAAIPEPPRARRSRWIVPAAAAAAGLIAGSLGAWAISRGSDSTAADNGHEIGRSALRPIDRHVTAGSVALVRASTGRSVDVSLRTRDHTRGFMEVWLLDPSTGQMVSLGVLSGERGAYAVPTGLNLARYDRVDVSAEPFDGNPLHSKVSVARAIVPGG